MTINSLRRFRPAFVPLEDRCVPTTFSFQEAEGASVAAIQASVDTFRTSLGTLNANTAGSVGSGRREINWDGVPNVLSAPTGLPASFFNTTSPRGVVLSTPGSGFQVSANAGIAPIEFDNLNATYSTAFNAFSAQRLFTAVGSNITDVTFFIPGSTTPASVSGFGAIFTDVDVAGGTKLEFFSNNNVLLFSRTALASTGGGNNGRFSFLGAKADTGTPIFNVRITSGAVALGGDDVTQGGANDVVAMDDFIYGEPLTPAAGGTVGGIVFNDLNGDGIRQAAEPVVPSIRVFEDNNANGLFDNAEKNTTTAADGTWSLAFVADGVRRIRHTRPSGTIQTTANVNVNVFGGSSDTLNFGDKANSAPTISDVGNQSSTGPAFGPLAFAVNDADTAAANLNVTAASSNTTLVPTANIVFGGDGDADRTVTVTPVAGQIGTATITLTVTDGNGGTATDSFTVTVTNVLDGEFSVGGDKGRGSVTLFNANGTVRFTLTPFGTGFTGGIRTAAGDVTGDGVADLIVASGPGIVGQVKVFNGVTQVEVPLPQTNLPNNQPFGPTFDRGIIVNTGDLNNDGKADLIITAEAGGGARVRVLQSTGSTFTQRSDFIALIGGDSKGDTGFRGGSRAAVADINGDGTGDLIWAAGAGGGPRIATFDGKRIDHGSNAAFKLTGDFFALSTTLRDGCFLAGGDFDGDGKQDLVAGGGSGAPPQVVIFRGSDLIQGRFVPFVDFTFGNPNTRQGVRVAAKDLDGDAKADLVVGSAPTAGSRVAAFSGKNLSGATTGATLLDFEVFPAFTGGVFVG